MDRQDLAARSNEVRAAGRDLIRGSVALRAYGAALRGRHPRSAAVPGESDGDGRTTEPRDAVETDGNGRNGAQPGEDDGHGLIGADAAVGDRPAPR